MVNTSIFILRKFGFNIMRLFEIQNTDELCRTIQNDCSEIIHIYRETNSRLTHDTQRSGKILFGTTQNRLPRHTPLRLQKNIDQKLQAMGFIAVRGNSLFCSTGGNSFKYGENRYTVFPVNGFQFTYSPNIRDLTMELWSEQSDDEDVDVVDNIMNMTPKEFVDYYEYTNKNILDGLNADCEIMIAGSYYLVDQNLAEKIS